MHELPQLNVVAPPPPPSLAMKVKLNLGSRYRALSLLAKGGMGAVYLAQQLGPAASKENEEESNQPTLVAVKVMHAHIADSPDTVNMFIDEARIGTRIDHPNVVRVLDTDVIEDTPFIVMEYIEGLSLSRLLRRLEDDEEAIKVDVVARVMHDALLGLGAAHDLEAIHRDVSPQNILIGVDGRSRITDFGVASFAGRLASTSPGEVRGKLGYLAPEQVSRTTGVDGRADVFAAGIVLWETLTGKELFATNDKAETLVRVLREPVPPPSSVTKTEIPTALEDACLRALERDRDRRFQSATDFAHAIANALPLATPEAVSALIERLGADILANQRRAREAARLFLEREDPAAAAAILAEAQNAPRAVALTEVETTTETVLRPAAPLPPPVPPAPAAPAVVAAKKEEAPSRTLRFALIGVGAVVLLGVGTILGRVGVAPSSSPSSPPPVASSIMIASSSSSSPPPVTSNVEPAPTQTHAANPTPPAPSSTGMRGFRRLPPRGHAPAVASGSPPSPAATPPAPRGTRLPDGTFVPEQL